MSGDHSQAVDLVSIDATLLRDGTASLFASLGLPSDAALLVADALVEADLEGVASHGVMLVPMYAVRLSTGSVSASTRARVIHEQGGCVVLDAVNMFGQLSAVQAVDLAVERACDFGIGAVAVRNAFHFGTAGRYARLMAERDCIGLVLSNTRPLMPAPGGTERVVGNNPMAIAMPTAHGIPVDIDMAMSATAMGRIRLAQQQGRAIPADWATDVDGLATTDPVAAIAGMLLPAAGPKGFGLAFMIDLLCGGLSAGGVGDQVRPLYGDPAEPYNCAHLFLALHVSHFRQIDAFKDAVDTLSERVRRSRPAAGIHRVYAPGELAWSRRLQSAGRCQIERRLLAEISNLCAANGVELRLEPRQLSGA
jgi:LDH2 family malate/lactate/ureidoglycolate dehydrogenase